MTPEERKRLADLLREVADDVEAERMAPRGGFINRELIFPGGDHEKPASHERIEMSFNGVRELGEP